MSLVGRVRGTSWPQLGSLHKDGSRFVGRDIGRVQPFWDAGTPVANQLFASSVDLALMSRVRIDDRLNVRFDGERFWVVYFHAQRLGRLTWSLSDFEPKPWKDNSSARLDKGTLRISRLKISASGGVVNCGGVVYPN